MPEDKSYEQMNYLEGMSVFQNARMGAFWEEVFSLVRGKPAELLSFEEIRARLRLREEYYQGLQDVPLEKIAGSVGRYREFTSKFLPRRGNMRERWSRVYAQATGLMGLPPIEVYKVGDVYFVRDGNHRVSVARQLGAKTIQAHVTELPTAISLHPGMSEDELEAATSYAEFLDLTRLPYTRPHHQSMQLTESSRYNELLGHIYLHQAVLEKQRGMNLAFEDAAADWYDNVYRPAVTLIRKYEVLRYDARRSEADMYLWMIEHLREAKEAYGEGARARTFSDALEDFLESRRIPVPDDLRAETDRTVTLARVDVDAELEAYRAREQAREALERERAELARTLSSSDGQQ